MTVSAAGVTGMPGTTTLSARAVTRIAARAAQEAGALPGRSGALDALTGPTQEPEADVVLIGDGCRITLTVGLVWPTPMRAQADRIRDHVAQRVGELSGLAVRRVDVDVVVLHPQPQERSLR